MGTLSVFATAHGSNSDPGGNYEGSLLGLRAMQMTRIRICERRGGVGGVLRALEEWRTLACSPDRFYDSGMMQFESQSGISWRA